MMASRTYLEMRDRRRLRPAARPHGRIEVARAVQCTAKEWRQMYIGVGRAHHWVDRLPWSDEEIETYLRDPSVSLWLMRVNGETAGYFELKRDADDGVEIAYFGLLPAFIGRGLGGYLLTVATERAWDLAPARVWLHTSTLDHPAALPNYLKRGFVIARREAYIVPV